jgi:pseudouridine-5'-phosphate glycosidase
VENPLHSKLPSAYQISPEVARALEMGHPVVALETTVITHGLPPPENLTLAVDMVQVVRSFGAVPATIGVLDGKIRVGMSLKQLERLVEKKALRKISRRDFAPVIARSESGGTTVAGTMIAANQVGIRVFGTGGIGGVHRQAPFDISTDLQELARTPVIVVCAGAKAILDLPATVEYLETMGVPVIGYQTDEFPAFYARSSGLPVSVRADTPKEVTAIAMAHWGLGLQSGILVVVPPPEEVALPGNEVEDAIEQALKEAQQAGVRGQQVTPFLLDRVSALTGRASLQANLGLLLKNAQVAAQIASVLSLGGKSKRI